jgi:RHS repeat-associated protein
VAYYLTDHLGSTVGLTDAGGNLIDQMAYYSFGKSLVAGGGGLEVVDDGEGDFDVGPGTWRMRYTYTGRERDPDTGLYYYRARWYDPQVGRFISEDPIGLEGGPNLYGYVENDPLNAVDPEGLVPKDKWYGYRNKDFRRWFHRCWEEGGEGRQNASKQEIEIAYAEWLSRGSPKGGNCWGGGKPNPSECKEPVPARKRIPGPLLEEFRLQEESARQKEQFWRKILIGDAAVGAVLLAPEGAGAAILRWISTGGRLVLAH